MEKKFGVTKSIASLSASEDRHVRAFHLIRCLAWAFVDQPHPVENKRARRAQSAGRAFLGQMSALSIKDSKRDDDRISAKKWLRWHQKQGGLLASISDYPPEDLVRLAFKSSGISKAHVVFCIVDYLVERKSGNLPGSTTIEAAKVHLETDRPHDVMALTAKAYGPIWETYAPAAAIIYASFKYWPNLRKLAEREAPLRRIEEMICTLAHREERMREFLRHLERGADNMEGTKAFRKAFRAIPRP